MNAEQRANSMGQRYPHMCRDGHVQIGHSDSEHEMCPLCRANAETQRVTDENEALRAQLDHVTIMGLIGQSRMRQAQPLADMLDDVDHLVMRKPRPDDIGGDQPLAEEEVSGDDHNLIVTALRYYADHA